MSDVHDKKTRSFNMSRIRGKNTKPEILVRKYLHSRGLRFRIHNPKLPGKPDIVLPKYRIAIFVNGCFWHMHDGCKNFVVPATRTNWWLEKLNKTAMNDKKNLSELRKQDWRTLVVWECELKRDKRDKTLAIVYEKIICQD